MDKIIILIINKKGGAGKPTVEKNIVALRKKNG